MPSRQERRQAERTAKRAPAQAGAAGSGGTAAARANPGGDWTTQAADFNLLFRALGAELVKQRAGEGDREAQWSLGCELMREAGTGVMGAAGRSPKADVGLALRTAQFPVAHTMRRLVT